MKFSIIIPVYNAGQKIEKTIQSILTQSSVVDGSNDFTCRVIDGASSDDTLRYIEKFSDERLQITSEPDNGMYDALAKGLKHADGDITCYLPAGEAFDSHAFSVVSQVFEKYPDINWLTGRAATRNSRGEITDSLLPHPFRRSFFECGMYGTRLNALQQESTFWRSELNSEFDLEYLKPLKLAGDYFLWKCLARENDLFVVNAQFASFTIEPDQLSKSIPGGYRKELRSIRRQPTLTERFHALLHRQYTKRAVPGRRAKRLVSYDHNTHEWVLRSK